MNELTHIEAIKLYVRAANYLSACQIYLSYNFLLERKLSFSDIKPRVLGHWGTCPGINFVYANANYLIKKHNVSAMFILGPGHGFPALQSNLFLEGTLEQFYPRAKKDFDGLSYLCSSFSWPYGFPSHSFPGTPGVILEGGELGYALSTAYGAILDNPDLLAICLIGDGEAETGPTATAWHASKFINPATNGTVLPILHLNGYKISGPTLYGRMTNKELKALFNGYGYEPLLVSGSNIYQKMADAMEYAYERIKLIKNNALKGENTFARFPMIILKTPKGWTGIKYLHGKKIEGNNLSHQTVVPDVHKDKVELLALEKWLKSYKFNELFNAQTGFNKQLNLIIPEKKLRMGNNDHAYSGRIYKDLKLPEINRVLQQIFSKSLGENAARMKASKVVNKAPLVQIEPGSINFSSMQFAGVYLEAVCKNANNNFRFFSPDEIYSNKLDAILGATDRAFMLPIKKWDVSLAQSGAVIEMLSEHTLQGLAQGYVLTGRHAVFASYEAFTQIVSSMADQYIKFLKVAREFSWRGDCSSLLYILTSSGWRQEHNGFSHQNPSFISNILIKHSSNVQVYFPPDAISTLYVLKKCLESKNGINVIVAGKTSEPCWLNETLAQKELDSNLMIWDFASDPNPEIVFCAIGDYLVKEAMAGIDCVKRVLPNVAIRFVNVLMLCGADEKYSSIFDSIDFNYYFTNSKPVIFNFHGYPETLKAMLFNQPNTQRFKVNGYIEQGSTTTPFDMCVRNGVSRYHVCIDAITALEKTSYINKDEAMKLINIFEQKIKEHKEFIIKFGYDQPEITEWKWKKK